MTPPEVCTRSTIKRRRRAAASLAAGVLVASVVTACGAEARTSTNGPYADSYERWQAAGVDDYTLTYVVTGGIGRVGPKSVRVVDGEVLDDEVLDDEVTDTETDDLTRFAPTWTVDDLFGELDAADVVINAAFDAELGYPTMLDLDPIEGAIDDEFSVEVVSLVPAG